MGGGALAAGLGIRAVARVCEVAPHTVRQWLVAAADQLKACSQYCLHDVPVTQVQLDERFALLRAGKAGEVSIERVNRPIRQHVAAVGRRVSTLCKGEDGRRTQVARYQTSYPFCLPHAS